MSPLRAALILILAGTATSAMAEQITCESRNERTEACGTVAPGSSVQMVQQLSNSPCVEGQSWGTGPDGDSIWVSGGCRAVFDVQPPAYSSTYDHRDDYRRGDDRGDRDDNHGQRYASADRLRAHARRACIRQAASGQSFGPDDVNTTDERWLGGGMFAVDLDTPDGHMTCTVDRDGNVQSLR